MNTKQDVQNRLGFRFSNASVDCPRRQYRKVPIASRFDEYILPCHRKYVIFPKRKITHTKISQKKVAVYTIIPYLDYKNYKIKKEGIAYEMYAV